MDTPIHTDKRELHLEELSLGRIVAYALDNGASDIHLKLSRPPAIRMEGVLRFPEIRKLTEDDMVRFLDEILNPQQCFLETGHSDLAVSVPGLGPFRVNCYRHRGTIAVAIARPSRCRSADCGIVYRNFTHCLPHVHVSVVK